MLKPLLRIIRPGSLILLMGMFFLGTGIADYLGSSINWSVGSIGILLSLLLTSSGRTLTTYFDLLPSSLMMSEKKAQELYQLTVSLQVFRRMLLQASAAMLTVCALLFALLLTQKLLNPASVTFLTLYFVLVFLSSVPPFSLARKGYGELLETIIIANLIPAFAFLLQEYEVHRLVIMLTLPITGFLLAMHLAQALSVYEQAFRSQVSNMMIRLGWERGITIHNLLILFSFAVIALAFLLGLPWRLVWPGLLCLPVGMYQIWQMRQIAAGVKPNWKMLNLTAVSLVSLSAYLITISLWIR